MRKPKRPLRYTPTAPVSLRAWRSHTRLVALLLLTAFALTAYHMASPPPSQAQTTPSANIVISQVYGGGGNSGALYKNDFIELYNRSATTVSINGWTVQYASTGSSSWQSTPLTGSIAPGSYYLVQEAAGSGGTNNLPTPVDATGNIAMNATNGKVALVTNSTLLTKICPQTDATETTVIRDFVGYGSTDCSEPSGSSTTTALGAANNTSVIRNGTGGTTGCTDTNNNRNDFTVSTPPNPRNSATTPTACGIGATITFDNAEQGCKFNDLTGLPAGSTFTWSHPITSTGTSRVLYVGVSTTLEGLFVVGAGPPTPRVSVKYGTVTMDHIGGKVSGEGLVPDTRAAVDMFRLTEAQLQTNTGDDTIEVTFLTAVNYAVGGSVSFNGVNQTTPNRPFVSNSGDTSVTPSNNPKVTVTSASNEVVLDTVGQGYDASGLVADPSQMEQWDGISCFDISSIGAGSTENGAASTLMSWTQGNDGPWAIGAISIIPLAPTQVKLASFDAAQTQGGGVRLRWQTGFEVNNLGFILYREEKGERTRVTPSVVAGSALMAGQDVRLTAGRSYTWLDRKGTVDSEYWLESIDLDGRRALHGPILPASFDTRRSVPEEKRSPLLDQLNAIARDGEGASSAQNEYPAQSNGEESGQKNYGPELFLSKGTALGSSIALAETPEERQRAIAAEARAVKLLVNHRGWYRVGQPELVAAGLSPSVLPQMLQLYADGVQVPIIVNTNNALQFGTGASIEFYGTGLDTPWSDTRTYWLIAGSTPGERINRTKLRTLTRPNLDGPGRRPANTTSNTTSNAPATAPVSTSVGESRQRPVENRGPVENTGPQPAKPFRRLLPLMLLPRETPLARPGKKVEPETEPAVPRTLLVESVAAEPPVTTDATPSGRRLSRKGFKHKRRKRKAAVKVNSREVSSRRLRSHAALSSMLPGSSAGGLAESFNYTIERAERTLYFAALKNGEADNFFGQLIGREPATLKLNVHHLASASGKSTLEVSLQGVTTEAHQVRVNLNGTDVGLLSFVGQEHASKQFTVKNSLLNQGENTLLLTALKGETDTSLVDRVGLIYQHTYFADNDVLTFTAQGQQSVIVDGFNNPGVRMLDITKPGQVEELVAPTEATANGYAVMFEMRQGGGTLLATTDDRLERPAGVVRNQPSAWHRFEQGADLLIVTHGSFINTLAPLADLRRSQGLTVAILDVEDIYDEFSYGAHSTPAVRDFLRWTREHWQRVPRYVLLVGDCSLDPHNYLGQGKSDFVPTRLVDTAYLETASDDSLADFDNDGVPEMAVGRLPVRTSAEAETVVGKTVAFQNGNLQRGALLVSDQKDGFDFEAANEEIRALLPPTMSVESVNRAGNDASVVRGQIIDGINRGPLLVNYLGHGSVEMWTGAGILRTTDTSALTNKESLSFFVIMTCLNGFAQDVYTESLAEALLRSEKGGAAAAWASSGLTEPDEQALMNRQLMRSLFGGQPVTLGDAILSAKAATQNMDTRRTWMLFGDPTTRLR